MPTAMMLAGGCAEQESRGNPSPRTNAFDFREGKPDWDLARTAIDSDQINHKMLVRALGSPELLDAKSRYNLACYLALAGFREGAIDQLEAIRWNRYELTQAPNDPAFRTLATDARFNALVRDAERQGGWSQQQNATRTEPGGEAPAPATIPVPRDSAFKRIIRFFRPN